MTFEPRHAVVESLRRVSRVIPQDTLDYVPNLEALRPHIVVHGGGWRSSVQQETRRHVIEVPFKWGGGPIKVASTGSIASTGLRSSSSTIAKRDG